MRELTPTDLRDRLDGENPPLVLDVREPWELEICCLPDALRIPMGQIAQARDRIERDRDLVVMCHHGGRSAQVVQYLQQQGFDRVFNLTGGIHAWASEVEPGMPTY